MDSMGLSMVNWRWELEVGSGQRDGEPAEQNQSGDDVEYEDDPASDILGLRCFLG